MKLNWAKNSRGAAMGLMGALLLSACATTGQPGAPIRTGPVVRAPAPQMPAPVPEVEKKAEPKTDPKVAEAKDKKEEELKAETQIKFAPRDGLTPPHMEGRDIQRLALLLPFSSPNPVLREEAASMLKAAEMAVFDRAESDVLLMAMDTGGNARGAGAATQAAVKNGADIILGPLLGGNVKASGRAARRSRTPVIGFSTDQSVAGNGVYLLSFPPEAEVERIVQYAADQGAQNFAFFGPQSGYGRVVETAYNRAVDAIGGAVTAQQNYTGSDITAMQGPARKLATDFNAKIEADEDRLFDAIILPEGGTALRSVAPLLTYYSSEMSLVQKLGTGRWNDPEAALEPALRGGIFAGPAQDGRKTFNTDYNLTYNAQPSRLASLAYDAVNIGALVSDGDPRLRGARLIDPEGFYGVDGFVRFRPDGTPQRGLAVYEVKAGRFDVIEPAPKSAQDQGL